MTNRIGVLGEGTAATVGTTTAYTVPVNKSARVQVMYRGVAGVNSTLSVAINGVTIFTTAALTSGNVSFSGRDKAHITDTAANVDGSTADKTVAPYVREYMLSAGDIVTYTIGTAAFSSMNMQVVGVEVDVA